MLGVEWSGDVGENFSDKIPDLEAGRTASDMFHGTIDLIGSSDEDYESDLKNNSESPRGKGDRRAKSPRKSSDVEQDVKDVVGNMVDFAERSMQFPIFGYDPDSFVKQEPLDLTGVPCQKPHCRGGCLCSSLRGAFQHAPTHCGKERCMFECRCQESGLSAIDDESHYADKTKRKKKIPNRFKDVVLGKAYEKLHARTLIDNSHLDSNSDSDYECKTLTSCKKASPISSPPKGPSPEPKKENSGSDKPLNWMHNERIASIKKAIQERRIGFLTNTMSEDQTLADVHVWCSLHNKYSCLCINYVYFSKTNNLLWKPSNKSRYLANKVMFDILLKEPTDQLYEVYPFNHGRFCARTYGAILDYGVRNKDEVFLSKRRLELDNNVLSYSNSYVKFKNFLLVKTGEPVSSAEPYEKSLKRYGPGKLIHIVKTKENFKVDVGEEDLNVRVDYQLEDISDEELDDVKTKCGRKRKLTMKMKELEEEKKREKEDEEEIKVKEEPVPVVPVVRKRGRPPKVKPNNLLNVTRRSSDVTERSTFREPTPEVELIPCAKIQKSKSLDAPEKRDKEPEVEMKREPSSPDYYSAESRMDMELEREDVVCAPDLHPKSGSDSSHSRKTKSESKAVKDCMGQEFREDHPKPFRGFSESDNSDGYESDDPFESIHSKQVHVLNPRPDGYPHVGLLCLTPGLGYLHVLESLQGRIVIVNPINLTARHTFINLASANEWLNQFMKSKIPFSPPNLTLQFILVSPMELKLKQAKLMSPEIFRDPNLVVTRNGLARLQLNAQINANCFYKKQSHRPHKKTSFDLRSFTVNPRIKSSTLIPNPKHALNRKRLRQEVKVYNDVTHSLPGRKMSFESPDGCVTFQRIPFEHTAPKIPKLTPPTIDLNSPRFKLNTDPSLQVTLRPLPNLTKILNKPLISIQSTD